MLIKVFESFCLIACFSMITAAANAQVITESQFLDSSVNNPNAEFGTAMAIDGNVAVIGAPKSGIGDVFQKGSAYVVHAVRRGVD